MVWLPSVLKHSGAGVPLCGVEIFFGWDEAQRPRDGRRRAGACVEEMVVWGMRRCVAEWETLRGRVGWGDGGVGDEALRCRVGDAAGAHLLGR